ncbi:MAG: WD40/YVTN/BNR-like repeat-containing protein [Longimicrobiales bacterium]
MSPNRLTITMRAAALSLLVAPTLLTAQAGRPAGPTSPQQRMLWFEQHQAAQQNSILKGPRWQFLGPTNISGRMTDIAVVQPKGLNYTVYVAGATGGVWKTDNEGTTWESIAQNMPTAAIGDVTLAPSNQNIVWVGTGEANIFRSSNAGAGVWKSADAGRTWQSMGLTGTNTIPRIVIHPTNPDIVYVAASGNEWTPNDERGTYKTTNGGRTWERVHFINNTTGTIDLLMDPSNPNTLYASTWQRVRRKWNDPRLEPGFDQSAIYKSTDAGRTWTAINNGLPEAKFRGRIGIDLARSNPRVLYAFVDNYEISRPAAAGELNAYGLQAAPVIRGATIFRSDNGGQNWRRVSEYDRNMERLAGTYGWVFGQIRVDPLLENRIYVMGVPLMVSDDAGKTFRSLCCMHGDHHGMWIDPANSNYVANVNDGGVSISYDGGRTFRSYIEGLPLVQFFNVTADLSSPFRVYGSIQDHGSRRSIVDLSRGRHNIPAQEWQNAPGGEGTIHAMDPRNPNIVYSTSFYGNLWRDDLASGERVNIVPRVPQGQLPLRMQWLTPFFLSPHNPDVVYHGSQYVHRSLDRGATWERISGDLTYNDSTKYGDIPYQTIFSLVESPLRQGLLYAGTDDGRVHASRDGGHIWMEITGNLAPGKFTAEIVASQYDEGLVYLVQNGKRDDDFAPYIWKSTDYGRTWSSITNNLTSGPVNVVKEDPKNRNVLYVGTDHGAYASVDGGRVWHALPSGLPTNYVHDLIIHPRDDILVAATHGRGMFALDARPIQKMTPEVLAAAVHVFDAEPLRAGGGGRGGGGGGGGTALYYWLKASGAAAITIRNREGQSVRELSGGSDAGINMTLLSAGGGGRGGGGAGDQAGGAAGAGTLGPGMYTVEVKQGSNTATALLTVSR